MSATGSSFDNKSLNGLETVPLEAFTPFDRKLTWTTMQITNFAI
jgi:hypothetical protein